MTLNCDVRCRGVYTRSERNERSVIDYIMVNEYMYRYFKLMEIDGEKVLYDLSDHVFVFIELTVTEERPKYMEQSWKKLSTLRLRMCSL